MTSSPNTLRDEARYTPEQIAEALGRPAPTPEQSEIISGDLSPRLIVAGAGSGKTATMVDRVVWLVVNGFVHAEEILGVTFTTKAAGELRHRLSARLAELRDLGLYQQEQDPEDPQLAPTVSTYHSYAKQLVAEYGLRIGVEKDVTLLTQAQQFQLAAQVVEHWDGPLPESVPAASTLISAVLTLSGECAEHLRTPEEVLASCTEELEKLRALPNAHPKQLKKEEKARADAVAVLEQKALTAQLARRYQRVKETMHVMDFGDLLAYAATMARRLPIIGEEQRALYKVVLLDEFQDTSHAQMTLFSSLFTDGHSVMAVGDPKQSIYGFRGASEGQLFDFYRHFHHPHPEQRTGYLTVAWRNDTRILDAANILAADLSRPRPWARATRQISVPDLRPGPEATPGRVLVGTFTSDGEEAQAIVGRIRDSREDALSAGATPPTQAVLCRTRRQFQTVLEACEQQGVPYELPGLSGLLQTPEVTDLVSTLRVLADPGRSDALMRILAGARWRIGPRDLMALNDWARFLVRRRREAILRGAVADLDTPDGQGPGEAPTETGTVASKEPQDARGEWERFLNTAGQESSESASLIEALETLPREGWTSRDGRSLSRTARERLTRLAAELEELRGYLGEDLGTLLHHIERVTLLDQELASHPGRTPHTARENIEAFHQAAADYTATAARLAASMDVAASLRRAPQDEGSGEDRLILSEARDHRYSVTSSATGVTAFLAWLEAAVEKEDGLSLPQRTADGSAVQILTLHGSKGLEWDEVYLPGLVEGIFPTQENDHWLRTKSLGALPWPMRGDADYLPQWDTSGASTQDLQASWEEFHAANRERTIAEERRLAYVGVTRARSLLCLSSSHWVATGVKPRKPSQFFTEIAEAAGLEELLTPKDAEHPNAASENDVAAAPAGSDRPDASAAAETPETPETRESPAGSAGEERSLSAELMQAAPAPDPEDRNPRSEEVTAALWPFDPLTRPHIGRWATVEELDALSDQPDGTALDPGPAASRREAVERAAALVESAREALRSGAEPEVSEEHPDAVAWREETDLLLGLAQEERSSSREPALPEHLSASVLVGLAQDAERVMRQFRRPLPRRPSVQARTGTSFHEWVESHYGTPAMLDLPSLMEPEDDPSEEESATRDPHGLEQLRKAFSESPWYHRQPWAVEYPLETPLNGYTLRGRVDAIFHRPDPGPGEHRWELVDWKTGRIPQGKDLEEKAVQLAVYRLGFAELMGIEPEQIRVCFHYVAQNRTVEPQNLPDRQRLAELLRRGV